MEWSLNVKSEVLVVFTLLWIRFHSVNISDIPLLVQDISLRVHYDSSVFAINSTLDFYDLSFLADEAMSLVSEKLEPS